MTQGKTLTDLNRVTFEFEDPLLMALCFDVLNKNLGETNVAGKVGVDLLKIIKIKDSELRSKDELIRHMKDENDEKDSEITRLNNIISAVIPPTPPPPTLKILKRRSSKKL
ncbi:hypothetical protein TrLO_g1439 [Triparma laevis f. longispina]|uniref:Uncharacterized protein n=1 Tax=Triparma laevis f. longispina TaxID=1714387 RepID=A0A9W7FPQ7_9STRA|nr:hypothetical protein TrLO_g1439 [Triparma laevis f. longispina]